MTSIRRQRNAAHNGSSQSPDNVVNTALLIAFHYPPCQESSGYLRALAFSRYLPRFGWNPVVLTASERAYSQREYGACTRIPENVRVVRAFSRDARERFSIRHKYPGFLEVPDRWSSWFLGAVPAGLRLIHQYRPRVMWATQPNPTAFLVAHVLHRLTGLPWIADFRDPIGPTDNRMAESVRRWIEGKTMHHCARAVFTTRGAAKIYASRFPAIPAERSALIPNGFEESDFSEVKCSRPRAERRPLQLVHSGSLYSEGRNPHALLEAIRELKSAAKLSNRDVELIFRAPGQEDHYRKLVDEANIGDIVRLKPAVHHDQALAEICGADGLLILQGRQHNGQIPAKVYEYMRSRRPILALTDPAGDTAETLREAGIHTIAPMDCANEIAVALTDFIANIRSGTASVAGEEAIARHTREAGARRLSKLFNEVSGFVSKAGSTNA